MARSLRLDLLVIDAVMRRGAWFGRTGTHDAALRACSTADNHANIYGVILVRNIETAGSHDVDVCVHRQVLR